MYGVLTYLGEKKNGKREDTDEDGRDLLRALLPLMLVLLAAYLGIRGI